MSKEFGTILSVKLVDNTAFRSLKPNVPGADIVAAAFQD